MRARTYLSLLSLGASISALGAATALAQPARALLICRDGAHVIARDTRGCDGHRGVDVGATRAFRQGGVRSDTRYTDHRRDDARRADPRYTDPRYADPRYADPRYADPRYADPRYADPRYAARDRARVGDHRAYHDDGHDEHRDGYRRP